MPEVSHPRGDTPRDPPKVKTSFHIR
jgi:hypothetical protein